MLWWKRKETPKHRRDKDSYYISNYFIASRLAKKRWRKYRKMERMKRKSERNPEEFLKSFPEEVLELVKKALVKREEKEPEPDYLKPMKV